MVLLVERSIRYAPCVNRTQMVLAFSFLASVVIVRGTARRTGVDQTRSPVSSQVVGAQVGALPASTGAIFPACGIGILIFSKYVIH
ncbi:hypothetical protein CQY21_27595 [Mycolicibacterium boenickei]|nr:hypothetical protein CQY21_27595 [Mycolicibacterium boenickei]